MKPNTYQIGDTDQRPWGTWLVLDIMPTAVVKKLIVAPGKRISLQRHRHRSERWIVVEGVATVQKEDEQFTLHPGQCAFLPQMCKHRLSNETDTPATLIEIQYGQFLSEDDIERFNDDYGRF